MTNVTSIKASKAAKAVKPSTAHNALPETTSGLILEADILAANKYAMAYLLADNAIENAERDFCKAFATNHEGHLKPAIKAGFKAIKDAGAFDGLSTQSVDNLSSAAQWIASQPYNTQDQLFEAAAFRKAYNAARWPVAAKTAEPIEQPASKESTAPAPAMPVYKAVPQNSHAAECNEVAMELNSVIEHINEIIHAYPAHIGNASLEALALDIGRAIEKAAHARLQQAVSPRQSVAA